MLPAQFVLAVPHAVDPERIGIVSGQETHPRRPAQGLLAMGVQKDGPLSGKRVDVRRVDVRVSIAVEDRLQVIDRDEKYVLRLSGFRMGRSRKHSADDETDKDCLEDSLVCGVLISMPAAWSFSFCPCHSKAISPTKGKASGEFHGSIVPVL